MNRVVRVRGNFVDILTRIALQIVILDRICSLAAFR